MRKAAAALAIAALALTGCDSISMPEVPDVPSASSTPTPSATTPSVPTEGQGRGERLPGTPEQDLIDAARIALPTLTVIGDNYDGQDGYERGCGEGEGCVFGPAWADNRNGKMERTGCDTRNNVIAETLDPATIVYRDGSDCVVQSGTYEEPYFGTIESFVRGEDTLEQDEIDHVIPLHLAWDLGAYQWPLEKRVEFANDAEFNLVLTTRAANAGGLDLDGDTYKDRQDLGEYEGKSDMGASDWLEWMTDPVRECNFAARYVLTSERYGLPVPESDARALTAALETCAGDKVPTPSVTPQPVAPSVPEPTTATPEPTTPQTEDAADEGGEVYYANCAEAREAGAAPLHRGKPGYRPQMDGDGDGIACE